MEWLNYHHLLYFWTVVRAGSIQKAADELRVSPPAISAQLKLLEAQLGEKLFMRSGRRLVLTETGRTVCSYAEDIFTLGRELMDVVKNRPIGRPFRLDVGIVDVMPKVVVPAGTSATSARGCSYCLPRGERRSTAWPARE